jgi:CDP-glucose 4,6-dehydratase
MSGKSFLTRIRNKKVLISGLTGFKGQWLARWLSHLGASVSGFGLEPINSIFGCKPNLHDAFDVEFFDIRDADRVEAFLRQRKPDVVYHLAAQPLVRESYQTPIDTFTTNVIGTVNLLDSIRRCPSVQAVVNVTSDKCYENREWHWGYRESEPMGGHDPYSASKGCSELVTASYRNAFLAKQGVGVATARAGNVIGGCDWSADRLLPDIARAVISDKPILIRRPDSVRPWQHVIEAVAGYLMLGEQLLRNPAGYAEPWNFGPGDADAIPVLALVQRVIDRWGRGCIELQVDPNAPHEAKYLKLDSSKAWDRLGWRALLTIDQRLDWTVDWYHQWSLDRNWWQQIDNQIETYQRILQKCLPTNESSSPAPVVSSAKPSAAA